MAEPLLRQRGKVMAARRAGIEHIGDQHGVVEGPNLDAVPAHHDDVVFHVLDDLEDRPVLEQRLKQRQRFADGDLVRQQAAAKQVTIAVHVGERHIDGAARRNRHGEADQVGLHRVGRGGLGVEGEEAGFLRLCDPGFERGRIANGCIGRRIDLARRRLFQAQRREQGRGVALRGSVFPSYCCGWLRGAVRRGRGSWHRRRAGAEIGAVGSVCALNGDRRGLDVADLGSGRFGDTAGQRGEFHGLQKADQFRSVRRMQGEIVQSLFQRHVVFQRH